MASSGVKGCKEVPTLALTSENAFEFESFSPPPFFSSIFFFGGGHILSSTIENKVFV